MTKGMGEEGVQEDSEPKMCLDLGGQWVAADYGRRPCILSGAI